MRVKIASASVAAGLGIIGTGVALAFPDAKFVGFVQMAVGILVFLFDLRVEHGPDLGGDRIGGLRFSKRAPSRHKMAIALGFCVVAGFMVVAKAYFWPLETRGLPNEAHIHIHHPGIESSVQLGISVWGVHGDLSERLCDLLNSMREKSRTFIVPRGNGNKQWREIVEAHPEDDPKYYAQDWLRAHFQFDKYEGPSWAKLHVNVYPTHPIGTGLATRRGIAIIKAATFGISLSQTAI